MNRLNHERRAAILGMLVEGNSMRATSRMADVSINTVTKLLVDVGSAAASYQTRVLRDLPCKRFQCDETWSFCYSKEKNVPAAMEGKNGVGDVLDLDCRHQTDSVMARFSTRRDLCPPIYARLGVALAVSGTGNDRWPPCLSECSHRAFAFAVDYAQLVKTYGPAAGRGRPL